MNTSDGERHAVNLEPSVQAMPRLYKILKRILGNSADAEDVLHDAYERYLTRPERYPLTGASVLTPVERLATAGAYELLKQRRATVAMSQDLVEEIEHALKPVMPDEHLNREQENEQLVKHIKQLPPPMRTVLVMHNVQELSRSEIATTLGISERAVTSRLRHSLLQLSRELHEMRPGSCTREIYRVSRQIATPTRQIIVDVAPQIVIASAALAQRLKREPQSVYNLAPRQFELLIAELLEDLGYRVEITPATRDGGKDLMAYLETELGTLLCLVEAKRYGRDHKVGVDIVRSLYGTVSDAQANQGMLITTSTFTQDAREFQRRHRYVLALKDYVDLERWIRSYGKRTS